MDEMQIIVAMRKRIAYSVGMKVNDVVKYSKPQDGESDLRFVLLHVEKGKADIQLVCDWAIRPVETVAVDEIEMAS
jgi:hypothetical protein